MNDKYGAALKILWDKTHFN